MKNSVSVSILRKKDQELCDNLRETVGAKKKIILELADIRRQRIEAGDLKIQLNEIARSIIDELEQEDRDLGESYIRQVLPAEYKRDYIKTNENAANSELELGEEKAADELADQDLITEVTKTETAIKTAKEFTRRKLERAATLRVEAAKRKLNVKSNVRDTKSTEKDPRANDLSNTLAAISGMFEILAQKTYQFPPSEDDVITFNREVEALKMFIRPLIDEKWTDSLIQWFNVEITNIIHGKHAAGKLMATTTTEGEERNLTREQVGDRFEAILEMACMITEKPKPKLERFLEERQGVLVVTPEGIERYHKECLPILEAAKKRGEANPWLYVLSVLWHKSYVAPRIAKRKVNLHEDFSNAA